MEAFAAVRAKQQLPVFKPQWVFKTTSTALLAAAVAATRAAVAVVVVLLITTLRLILVIFFLVEATRAARCAQVEPAHGLGFSRSLQEPRYRVELERVFGRSQGQIGC